MKRLDDIFLATVTPSIDGGEARLEVAGAIEWDHVSFSYFAHEGSRPGENGRDGHYALRDVSVKIAAGEKLAIVGRTGSGKSTMVKLLTRLIEPTAGRVMLDGRDMRDLPLGALRKTIGMVPQEPTLFSDTMARNIAFGRADASLDEIDPRRERGRPRVRYRGAAAWSCDTLSASAECRSRADRSSASRSRGC